MGYSKLDSDITESSVWAEDHETLRVWVYLLAKKDYFGEVHVTPPALAMHCGVPLSRVEEILRKFESPDPHSRSKENEGRRIAIDRQDDYTVVVLNSDKYRHKDYSHAERQRRYQKKKNELLTDSDAGSVPPPSFLSDSDGQITDKYLNTMSEDKTPPTAKRRGRPAKTDPRVLPLVRFFESEFERTRKVKPLIAYSKVVPMFKRLLSVAGEEEIRATVSFFFSNPTAFAEDNSLFEPEFFVKSFNKLRVRMKESDQ